VNLLEMCSTSSWRVGFRRAWLGRTKQEDRWRQGRKRRDTGSVVSLSVPIEAVQVAVLQRRCRCRCLCEACDDQEGCLI
jgi:hypothetical protein